MSLNETPSGERVHISFFGNRNAGKSSLVNAFTNQELAVVSKTLGTTTDPVKKAMELLPIGPVVIIDTPGFDDVGELGEKRIAKTKEVLGRTDYAVLVVDATKGLDAHDQMLVNIFKERSIPYMVVYNKMDALATLSPLGEHEMYVSALKKTNIEALKETIAHAKATKTPPLVHDLVHHGDVVVLVIPIDESAPKGRLILPQQLVLRDLLDCGCLPICTREKELALTLSSLKQDPALVITDSQAFEIVSQIVPERIPLTSFSILMARYKGTLKDQVNGIKAIETLQEGDQVLISEGCTHHRQCKDIGTVKLPHWLLEYTSHKVQITTSSGYSFPEDLTPYKMIIHCGGCMLNAKEMQSRLRAAKAQGVPMTNYGTAIAYMHGILGRALKPLHEYE